MITIFNRKELINTFSIEQRVKIRDVLEANNINYFLRCINRNNPSVFGADMHAVIGTIGENMDYENEYIFYVHKNDYDKARYVMNL